MAKRMFFGFFCKDVQQEVTAGMLGWLGIIAVMLCTALYAYLHQIIGRKVAIFSRNIDRLSAKYIDREEIFFPSDFWILVISGSLWWLFIIFIPLQFMCLIMLRAYRFSWRDRP